MEKKTEYVFHTLLYVDVTFTGENPENVTYHTLLYLGRILTREKTTKNILYHVIYRTKLGLLLNHEVSIDIRFIDNIIRFIPVSTTFMGYPVCIFIGHWPGLSLL